LIRFGPAAAPRWFNQNLERFREYIELIAGAGGSAIEFVAFPGVGSDELGRVHLLQPIARKAISYAHAAGFHVNLHSPLTTEFKITEWANDRDAYRLRFAPMLDLIHFAESGQVAPPVLVIHAAADHPETTGAYLEWLSGELDERGSNTRLSLELRTTEGPADHRFDRSIESLGSFLIELDLPRTGMCWDVAHDWESGGSITPLSPRALRWINHVHIHDSRADAAVHAPLDAGLVPWREAVAALKDVGWEGSITLEIRYRYAAELGEPWNVLEASLRSFQSVLAGE